MLQNSSVWHTKLSILCLASDNIRQSNGFGISVLCAMLVTAGLWIQGSQVGHATLHLLSSSPRKDLDLDDLNV